MMTCKHMNAITVISVEMAYLYFTVHECKKNTDWVAFSVDCSALFFPLSKSLHPLLVEKVADGQSLKDAAKTRIFGALEEDINKIVPHMDGQSGSGSRRKRFRRHRPSHRGQSKKKRKLDIFS